MESKGTVVVAPEKYAIFKIGTRQYHAVEGETLETEKVEGEVGAKVEFSEVLLRKAGEEDVAIGQPLVEGAKVVAEIVEQKKGPKVIVFKRKRRKRYRVKKGHRQPVTVLKILSV